MDRVLSRFFITNSLNGEEKKRRVEKERKSYKNEKEVLFKNENKSKNNNDYDVNNNKNNNYNDNNNNDNDDNDNDNYGTDYYRAFRTSLIRERKEGNNKSEFN